MEQTSLLNEFTETTFEPATTGQRLANYLIDIIVAYMVIFLLMIPIGMSIGAEAGSASF